MLESINLYTMVFALINLLILFVVLKKVLFKPVMTYMQKRSDGIADDLKTSEEAKAEALALKDQYEEQMKSAKADGQKIIDDMTARANKIYEATVAQAENESKQILARAEADAAREHEKAIKESKAQIAGLALAAATKVIEANMDTEKNRELVDEFLKETGAA